MDRPMSRRLAIWLTAAMSLAATSAQAHKIVGKSRAAIVQNADLVGVFDLAALQQSPILKRLESEAEADASPEASERRELWERLSGLGKENLVSLWFSVDFGALTPDSMTQPPSFDELDALMAIQLATPLEFDTLREAIQIGAEGQASSSVTEIGGTQAIVVANEDPEQPSLMAALTDDGNTILLGVRRQSLEEGLARAASDGYFSLPEGLQQTLDTDTHHARVAFIAPDELRAAIAQELAKAEGDPEAAMTSGFLTPFQSLQSFSMAMSFTEDLELDLVSDLGNEGAANQALGMYQMVLPMLKGMLAEKSGREPASYNEMISAGADGTELALRFRLTEAALKELQEQNKKTTKTDGEPR